MCSATLNGDRHDQIRTDLDATIPACAQEPYRDSLIVQVLPASKRQLLLKAAAKEVVQSRLLRAVRSKDSAREWM